MTEADRADSLKNLKCDRVIYFSRSRADRSIRYILYTHGPLHKEFWELITFQYLSKMSSLTVYLRSLSLTTRNLLRCYSSVNIKGIQEEFTRQASGFERDWNKRSCRSTKEIMTWALKHITILPSAKSCLDVAAGTCIFARALSKTGKFDSVVALDATAAMLEEGKVQCAAEGISNINFVIGDAGKIPYPDNSFDIVACRLCIHHFDKPVNKIREMSRVLKPGGFCVIVDIISSDDKEVANVQNRLEILRDPSHTRMLPLSEIIESLKSVGLRPMLSEDSTPTIVNTMDLHGWMDSTRTPPHARMEIEQAINAELKGRGPKTGFGPTINSTGRNERDPTIYFEHIYAVVQAKK